MEPKVREKIIEASMRGDHETVLQVVRPLAKHGDAEAQMVLGIAYRKGQGVEKDYTKAAEWFWKSAAQDFASAHDFLGDMYWHGWGMPENIDVALGCYLKAADQGYATSQETLSDIYADDDGKVPQDLLEAHKWLSLCIAHTRSPRGEGDVVTLEKLTRELVAERREKLARLERDMTPNQVTEAQRLAHEWVPAS